MDPNKELCELLDDPTCPFWVQNLVPVILKLDPVDAVNITKKLAEILERRMDSLLAVAQSFADGQRHEPVWTLEEEREHERIHGVATPAEACQEYARNVGEDRPDQQWLLTNYDTWEKNPHYRGEGQPHPESYELSDLDHDPDGPFVDSKGGRA